MTPASYELPDHLLLWLEATQRRVRQHVLERAEPGRLIVRGSQGRILQLIPDEGTRMTTLAERAHMTKQALGQLVDLLERKQLVRSSKDPNDARVRLVHRTERGERARAEMERLIAEAEASLREEIGPSRYDAMKAALRDLGAMTA